MIISLKLCRNLCSFRWLKSNLKRVNSFTPLISWTSKTEVSLGLTKFMMLVLNVFIEFIFLSSSLRFPHASAQWGKKDDSKVLFLAGKVFILFWVEDWVKGLSVVRNYLRTESAPLKFVLFKFEWNNPANVYLFTINNRNSNKGVKYVQN